MRNKIMQVINGFTIFVISTSAFAAISVPCGWYIEPNIGSSHISGKEYPGNASLSGIGGSVNVGYKFFPYFATELDYTRYAKTTIELPRTDKEAATDKHYSYGIDIKGIMPFGFTGLEVFAKVGGARMASSMEINNQKAAKLLGLSGTSHTKTGLYAGVGGQYDITPEFAAVVQYAEAWGNSSTGTGTLFSVGITFMVD